MSAGGTSQDRRVVRQSFLSGGTATVAIGSGLILDIVAAAVFGAGRETDAFVVAARVPLALTAIMMLVGNQLLVATYATWSVTVDERRRRRLVTTVVTGALVVGVLLAAVLSLVAPYLVVVLSPGFDREQHVLAAELLRVMVWMVPLIAGCEALRAWLNSRHLFVVPAAMTIALNLVAVAVVVLGTRDITTLPLAYVAGAAVQFVLMVGFALLRGLRLTLPAPRDPEIRTLARLTGRPSLSAALNPVTRAAETIVASFLPPGSATILHYGQRAVSAIGGTVLFRSVMLAVLPRLTRAIVADDRAASARLADLGMRLMVIVSFPLTAIALVLAVPATESTFGVGRFTLEDARLLGLVMTVLALSFPFSAVQRALLAPFYAARNTRVPLHNTVIGVVVNLGLLALCLLLPIQREAAVLAIAGAYVGANVANVVHAWWAVRRSDLVVPRAGRAVVLRSTAGSGLAAAAAWFTWTNSAGPELARVIVAAIAGVLVVLLVELPGRVRPPQRETTRVVLVALLALPTAAAVTLSSLALVDGAGLLATMLPVGLLVAIAFISLALARFEVFVLALLVARTSMDALRLGSSNPAAEPAALVGLLFLGAGLFWLAAQWRADGAVRLSRLGWAVTVFAGAALLGVLVAPDLWPALVEWVRLASVCLMVLVTERLARTPGFRSRLLVAVTAAAVVPLLAGAWQVWSGSGLFDAGGFGRVRGTFTHSNPMAAFLAMLVVMAFAHVVHLRDARYRLAAGLVCTAASAGLFLTYTRAAWLAAVLGIVIVAATGGRRWVLGIAGVVLAALLLLPGAASRFADLGNDVSPRGEPGNSLTWRAQYWAESLTLSADSPVTGIGLKQVVEESSEGKQPHNDYLRAYVELGVVGLAAYLWFMAQLLATGVRAMRATAADSRRRYAFAVGFCGVAAGYLLMSLVANLMSQVVVGIYLAALAGAASALVPDQEPDPDLREQRERRELEEVGR
ncbi:MAG: lipid II flippase MurJ [Nocardioides sp.]